MFSFAWTLFFCVVLTAGASEAVVLHVRPSARVVLGVAADPFAVPFYCTLYSEYDDDSGTSVCGCVLLENDRALTAAHCVTKFDGRFLRRASAMFVRLYGDMRTPDGDLLRLDVGSTRVAPGYRYHDLHDDVAVFTVPNTAVVAGLTGGVRVNEDRGRWDALTSWDKLQVVGVGLDRYDALSLGAPRVADLSRRSCTNPVGFGNLLPWTEEVFHDDICAGPFSPCDADYRCADSCKGDSGGPLYATLSNGTVVVYGIVSRGSTTCGVAGEFDGRPGIYAATDLHVDFVRDESATYLGQTVSSAATKTRPENIVSRFILGCCVILLLSLSR